MTNIELVAREPLGFVAIITYFICMYRLFELVSLEVFVRFRNIGAPFAAAVIAGLLVSFAVYFLIHTLLNVHLV